MHLRELKLPVGWPQSSSFQWISNQSHSISLEWLLKAHRAYDVAPYRDGNGVIRARLSFPIDPWKRPDSPATPSIRVDRQGRKVRAVVECTCSSYLVCHHVLTVMVDMCILPEFGQAVLDGKPSEKLLEQLQARRGEVLQERQVGALLGVWGVASTERNRQARYLLNPGWFRRSYDGYQRDEEGRTPGFSLDVQLDGRSGILAFEDVDKVPLAAEDRTLLSLCQPGGVFEGGCFHAVGPTGSVVLDKLRERQVRLEEAEPPVEFVPLALWPRLVPRKTGETVRELETVWSNDEGTMEFPMVRTHFVPGPQPFLIIPARRLIAELASDVDQELAMRMQRAPIMELGDVDPRAMYLALRRSMRGRNIRLPAAEQMDAADLGPPRIVVRIDGTPLEVRGRVLAEYGFAAVDVVPNGAELDERRDAELETAVLRVLHDAGFRYDEKARAHMALADDAVTLWRQGIKQLRAHAAPVLDIQVADNLRRVRLAGPIKISASVGLAGQMLDTKVEISIDGMRADMDLIRQALRDKRRWLQLSDGALAEIQERVRAVLEDVEETVDAQGHAMLPRHHLGRLEHWLREVDEVTVDAAVESWRTRLRAGAVSSSPRPPRGLEATLRPYQVEGLAWLQLLEGLGVGGILADDMGLGKTVQVLAWLCSMKRRKGPSLVVCPTSVASNWMAEAARFAPMLRTLLWHGGRRSSDGAAFGQSDLVITTYGVLRQDAEMLAARPWHCLIVDEAQFVKNADALTTRVIKRIDAQLRVALTGTPVENRLLELWSIMDLCNPGMLGTRKRFETRTERLILRDPQGPSAQRLRAMVAPFVLRRTKRQVLTDLPEKQEMDRACVPSRRQRELYDATAALVRKDVNKAMKKKGVDHTKLLVLAALTRLRQIACDPRLLVPTADPEHSGKRLEFLSLLEALVSEGRRVLVFSQFVELLQLWKADLDRMQIAYEYLDGSTQNRGEVVQRFQEGDAPVFLISLKAGGTGLNLTAADTVILCDPWWNPAVEDQATDRAHRIGQTRKVTVYRLITQGTVEEKIVTMKAGKRRIADAVLGGDVGALRGLTEDDVALLLGDIDMPALPDDEPPSEPIVVDLTQPREPRR